MWLVTALVFSLPLTLAKPAELRRQLRQSWRNLTRPQPQKGGLRPVTNLIKFYLNRREAEFVHRSHQSMQLQVIDLTEKCQGKVKVGNRYRLLQ
jgi:hypothetical protein